MMIWLKKSEKSSESNFSTKVRSGARAEIAVVVARCREDLGWLQNPPWAEYAEAEVYVYEFKIILTY